jgi:hypothetical protein
MMTLGLVQFVHFPSSYFILWLVSSTVIFWTGLRCWSKSYSDKVMLLLYHSYKKSMVISNWLTVTKYPHFKWQGICSLWRSGFLSTITEKTFAGTLVHPGHFGSPRTLWFTPDTLVHPGHFGSPRALVGSLLLIIFSFLFYLYSFCALHPMLPVSLGGPFLVDCPFVPYIQCCLCLLVVHS